MSNPSDEAIQLATAYLTKVFGRPPFPPAIKALAEIFDEVRRAGIEEMRERAAGWCEYAAQKLDTDPRIVRNPKGKTNTADVLIVASAAIRDMEV
jgi:hypothetical protein